MILEKDLYNIRISKHPLDQFEYIEKVIKRMVARLQVLEQQRLRSNYVWGKRKNIPTNGSV